MITKFIKKIFGKQAKYVSANDKKFSVINQIIRCRETDFEVYLREKYGLKESGE